MQEILELIQHHKERLSRLDDGQIWWSDVHVAPFTKMYKDDRDEYINALEAITCDPKHDKRTRLSAYNLYNLVWFSEKGKSTDIVPRIRASFQNIIHENDSPIRNELLCYIDKFCHGTSDRLLLSAYKKAIKDDDSSFEIILYILRKFELTEQIPESRENLYANFRLGIEQVIPFEKRLDYLKRQSDGNVEERKRHILTRLTDVVERGDVEIVVKIIQCMYKSKYTTESNRRVMASYLRHVPKIWNKLPKEVRAYG